MTEIATISGRMDEREVELLLARDVLQVFEPVEQTAAQE
jgi:hypothetical protein